ncbi:hypothetical protein HanRHA438_Chr00c21g0852361 [Helianthus annuus]|nr:hypothetical protein HanXRQr2_Chr13g0614831 [Helianthus annuus]KAJ0483638.1 hypothetical protein HanIR_Chr13g0666961 [Helianthus annuus]KAJ0851423.1 hypothetical protein HanPSC8_Chr13g0592021 [Helianthus annuus]KAJ0954291.1 hypothetical protein HanRHA438_Chr00c21g0852361 [Helianthus annuus]
MKPLSILCVFLAVFILVYANSIEASRVLHVKYGRLVDLKSANKLVLQSLPKGQVSPSGPSGCTYIPGSGGPPCP